jgi:acyl-CoA synthetase (AMP-forming)/AMP-acid ligase II
VQSVVTDLFRLQTARAGGAPAISFRDQTMTRAALLELTDVVTERLRRSILDTATSTIAIACSSPSVAFAALHASLSIGAGSVLCDPSWERAARATALSRVNATHLLTASDEDDLLVVALDEESNVDTASDRSVDRVRPYEVVFFTSGTTGSPSAIIHSDRTIASALWLLVAGNGIVVDTGAIGDPVEALVSAIKNSPADAFESGPVLVSCLPPWTHAGFTMMNYATLTGSHLMVGWPFDPASTLELVELSSASSIGLSPFMAQLLLRTQRRLGRDVGSLFVVGLGAGPVSPGLAQEIEVVFDCAVSIGYGLTETGGAVMRSRWTDPAGVRTSTVGTPLPGVELSFGAQHALTPIGGSEELSVRTPAMMEGTISPDGSRVPFPRNSWYATGDLAAVTPEGAVQIVGRLSDVIIRGGRNIDPKRIEDALIAHDAVRECAVIGVNSRVEGEQEICAAVVLNEDCAADAVALTSFCRTRLAGFEVPTRIRFLSSLPRTNDGGVRRIELAEQLGQR